MEAAGRRLSPALARYRSGTPAPVEVLASNGGRGCARDRGEPSRAHLAIAYGSYVLGSIPGRDPGPNTLGVPITTDYDLFEVGITVNSRSD